MERARRAASRAEARAGRSRQGLIDGAGSTRREQGGGACRAESASGHRRWNGLGAGPRRALSTGVSSAERARRRSKAGVVGEQGGQSSGVARAEALRLGAGQSSGWRPSAGEWGDGKVTEQMRAARPESSASRQGILFSGTTPLFKLLNQTSAYSARSDAMHAFLSSL
jgi:hypothetical protein